ncbi:hypothetical protein EGK75_08665 [Neisseria weixii]|uniref:Uncharacterized protein n=1 Tax=Neisseria weixii TaxID=1853276 RepID=A0A3N4MVB2_9NEIS|nr:hypothetical protein CGZ65_10230 [Neisseria weixii]RPD83139.1 hypothetical protein EGK74_13365 [Neisseria weixii]RPD86706.1 hypothetical protein EGK75_08665 [Neisseria weixii]
MTIDKPSGGDKAKIPKRELGDFAVPASFKQTYRNLKMQITFRFGKLLLTVSVDTRAILALIMLFSQ